MDSVLSSKYWLVRKVVAVVGYFGGFRNSELKTLQFGFLKDFANNPTAERVWEKSEDGSYWFKFYRSKQRGTKVLSQICVPKCSKELIECRESVDRIPVGVCPASVIDQYLNVLATDLNCAVEDLKGDFFKSTHGKNANMFVRVPLGKNKLARVGIEFAEELLLPNPKAYTGHCWRRSCSTNSSDAGVNVTSLMAHMGWSDPKTAIRYVQKSKQSAHQMAMYLCNAQRFNLKEEDLFRFPKVVPVMASSYVPPRIQITAPAIPSSSSLLPGCASGLLPSSLSVPGPLFQSCDSNEVTEYKVVKTLEDSSSVALSEGLIPLPAVGVDNQRLETKVASCLTGLVGSIVNSGTIHFNVSFVTK